MWSQPPLLQCSPISLLKRRHGPQTPNSIRSAILTLVRALTKSAEFSHTKVQDVVTNGRNNPSSGPQATSPSISLDEILPYLASVAAQNIWKGQCLKHRPFHSKPSGQCDWLPRPSTERTRPLVSVHRSARSPRTIQNIFDRVVVVEVIELRFHGNDRSVITA